MTTSNDPRYPIQLATRMLPADAVFWYAEEATPQLRPYVGALMLLDRAPQQPFLRGAMERLTQRVPRLRQRVAPLRLGIGPPHWEEHREFAIDYHLRAVLLPAPATQRCLLDLVATVIASPLDHLRPLWEAYLIEGMEGGRAALFFKAHHAIVDGVGGLAILEALTDTKRGTAGLSALKPRCANGRAVANPNGADSSLSLWDAASSVTDAAARVVRDPWGTMEDGYRLWRVINGVIGDLQATKPLADPIVRESEGIGRHLELVDFSLKQLCEVKQALGVSLNDVMLTALAGALGRYHDRHRKHVDALNCMVPINLRRDHERRQLGNRVGVFNVTLPVGERSPLLRLAHVHSQTHAAKGDRRGTAYPLLLGLASLMPRLAFRAMAQQVVGRFHLICTNIPGPSTRRYLAGARVETIYPFAPLFLGAPLAVALLSYGDSLAIGIDADPTALPRPESLRQHLREAVDELLALTRTAPTQRTRRPPKRAQPPRRPPKRAARSRRVLAS